MQSLALTGLLVEEHQGGFGAVFEAREVNIFVY
jgi:hypothetical protein